MTTLLIFYCVCAFLLMTYGANCYVAAWLFRRRYPARARENRRLLQEFYGGPVPGGDARAFADRLPVVTTQLPIFNELNVAERLIEAVAAFRYPPGRHEIQVLDDSTDETREIVARKVAELRARGVDITHVTRRERTGFKAGALAEGLKTARGEVLAIFDADFRPGPDFLLRSAPYFEQDWRLGFLQGRWGHLNRDESLITRLQSIGINGHFMVEQSARDAAELFMNFNGTAGLFRRAAIEDAGGWQADTLTEDMDLSYRIQLAGWERRYVADLVAPAEIPADMNAFKSQQFRWAKGSIQTAMKLLPSVLRSNARPFAKLQAVLHLTHYCVHPLMLCMAVLALPILLWGGFRLPPELYFLFGCLLALSVSGPSVLYVTAESALGASPWKTVLSMPVMAAFGCGMAVSNSRAVLEALAGVQSGFMRTPKRGFSALKSYAAAASAGHWLEIAVGLWCAVGMAVYFQSAHYLVGHFLLVYAAGFLTVGVLSWRHGRDRGGTSSKRFPLGIPLQNVLLCSRAVAGNPLFSRFAGLGVAVGQSCVRAIKGLGRGSSRGRTLFKGFPPRNLPTPKK